MVIVLTTAAPALADSARPTNYRSEVTSNGHSSVEAEVVGGDAFLEISVRVGTEVVVLGYQSEPYLRIDQDGRVFTNTNSPAYYLNNDRYAETAVPVTASAEADPAWMQAGNGGRFGWHDHRIHWMAPAPPPGVDDGAVTEIQQWSIPVLVDGEPIMITGVLEWLPRVSPVPWIGLGLATFAGMLVLPLPVSSTHCPGCHLRRSLRAHRRDQPDKGVTPRARWRAAGVVAAASRSRSGAGRLVYTAEDGDFRRPRNRLAGSVGRAPNRQHVDARSPDRSRAGTRTRTHCGHPCGLSRQRPRGGSHGAAIKHEPRVRTDIVYPSGPTERSKTGDL